MRRLATLFGAEPIGLGGRNVESLTGFFARLCIARYVQPTHVIRAFFIDRCRTGVFPPNPVQVGNFLSADCGKLDLQPDSALPFGGALESLTHLSGLHRLTFSACARALTAGTNVALGRRHKQWCPSCFAAWQADGSPLYEPLLWRFALVERCPVHRVVLLKLCPTCDRRQPLVTQGVPIGHCVRCGHPLHDGALRSAPDEAALDVPDRWALCRAVALSRLLAWTSALKAGFVVRPDVMAGRFSRLLAHALERPPVPWMDCRLRLAGLLGIETGTLYRLFSGERCPSLVALVDSCMQLGVDPVRLVRGDFHAEDRSWPPQEASGLVPCGDTWRLPVEVRERRSARRYPGRARALDEFIGDSAAVDFGQLLRRHGGTFGSWSVAFPLRYARAAELRVERVARDRQLQSQRLNAALDREIAAGARRSITEVAESLGVSSGVLHYYSPDRSARVVGMREAFHSTRRPGLRDRVHAALLAALRVPEGPSLHEVMRSLGVGDFVAASLCPEQYRLLVDERAREQKYRRERCVAAMREDLGRPRPRGVYWVAARLGVCAKTLRRADSQLYRTVILSGVRLARAGAARRVRESAARARADALRARRFRLAQAVDRELRSDSPRSARAVALECGVPPSVLAYHCPEPYRRLVELRKGRRRGVH